MASQTLARVRRAAAGRGGRRVEAAPRGVAAVVAAQAPGAAYHEVVPLERVEMPRLPRLSRNEWNALRVRDVDYLPACFVLELAEGRVVGDGGWVLTSGGDLVDDLWAEVGFPATSLAAGSLRVQRAPSTHLGGTVVPLVMPWLPNYYHWTLQALPRVELIAKVVAPESVDHWLVPADPAAYVVEWLDRVGIPEDRRIGLSAERSYTCERLVVASIPARNRHIPRWIVEFLGEEFPTGELATGELPAGKQGEPDRIFVVRKRSERRRLSNAGEVEAVFREFGFHVTELDGLTVAEQVRLFRGATVVAGVLGAGLTNIVYCRPGTEVIELLPNNLLFPAYYKLSLAAGLRHQFVRGTEPRVPRPFYFPDVNADLTIDPAALRDVLGDINYWR